MPLKLGDIKVGDKLIADGGFTCIQAGRICEVKANDAGQLYIDCCGCVVDLRDGGYDPAALKYDQQHSLSGQVDLGIVVGLEKASG